MLKPDVSIHWVGSFNKLFEDEIGFSAHFIDFDWYWTEPHFFNSPIFWKIILQLGVLCWQVDVTDEDCGLGSVLLDDLVLLLNCFGFLLLECFYLSCLLCGNLGQLNFLCYNIEEIVVLSRTWVLVSFLKQGRQHKLKWFIIIKVNSWKIEKYYHRIYMTELMISYS